MENENVKLQMETIAEKREYSFLDDGKRMIGAYWTMKSDVTFEAREKLLPRQERGLLGRWRGYGEKIPTSKQLFILGRWRGYGKKIPTSKQLFILGRWRRVYCDIFSNSGVCYVIVDGQEINVDDSNMEG